MAVRRGAIEMNRQEAAVALKKIQMELREDVR
jgi:hypothetical protein